MAKDEEKDMGEEEEERDSGKESDDERSGSKGKDKSGDDDEGVEEIAGPTVIRPLPEKEVIKTLKSMKPFWDRVHFFAPGWEAWDKPPEGFLDQYADIAEEDLEEGLPSAKAKKKPAKSGSKSKENKKGKENGDEEGESRNAAEDGEG